MSNRLECRNLTKDYGNAMKFLDDNPSVADEIEQKIREYYKNNNDYDDTASIGSTESESSSSADLDGLGPDVDPEDLITPIPDDL